MALATAPPQHALSPDAFQLQPHQRGGVTGKPFMVNNNGFNVELLPTRHIGVTPAARRCLLRTRKREVAAFPAGLQPMRPPHLARRDIEESRRRANEQRIGHLYRRQHNAQPLNVQGAMPGIVGGQIFTNVDRSDKGNPNWRPKLDARGVYTAQEGLLSSFGTGSNPKMRAHGSATDVQGRFTHLAQEHNRNQIAGIGRSYVSRSHAAHDVGQLSDTPDPIYMPRTRMPSNPYAGDRTDVRNPRVTGVLNATWRRDGHEMQAQRTRF